MKAHIWIHVLLAGCFVFVGPTTGLFIANAPLAAWAGDSMVYRLDWHEGYLGRTRELLAPGRPLGRFLEKSDSEPDSVQASVAPAKDLPEGGGAAGVSVPHPLGDNTPPSPFDGMRFQGCLKDAIPLLKLEFQILTAADVNAEVPPEQDILIDIIEAELDEQRAVRIDGRRGFPCSKHLGPLAIPSRNVLEDLKTALSLDASSKLRADDQGKFWIAFVAAQDSRNPLATQAIWSDILRDLSLRVAFEGAKSLPAFAELKERIARERRVSPHSEALRDRIQIEDTAWREAYEIGLNQASKEVAKLRFERDGR